MNRFLFWVSYPMPYEMKETVYGVGGYTSQVTYSYENKPGPQEGPMIFDTISLASVYSTILREMLAAGTITGFRMKRYGAWGLEDQEVIGELGESKE